MSDSEDSTPPSSNDGEMSGSSSDAGSQASNEDNQLPNEHAVPSPGNDNEVTSSSDKDVVPPPAKKAFIEKKLIGTKYLVLQGGGVKGVGYIGAVGALEAILEQQEEDFSKFQAVCGTSVGSLIAAALAVKYDAKGLLELLENQDISGLLDPTTLQIEDDALNPGANMWPKIDTALRSAATLYNEHGICSGEQLRKFVETVLETKTGKSFLTFRELHELVETEKENAENKTGNSYKELFVVVHNASIGEEMMFCFERTPDVIISDACRASASIPALFVPHHIYSKVDGVRTKDPEGDVLVDGAVLYNYPFKLFQQEIKDTDHSTIGLYLASNKDKARLEGAKYNGPRRDLGTALNLTLAIIVDVMRQQGAHLALETDILDRTVIIDSLDISTFDFHISLENKNLLIKSGWDSTLRKYGMNERACDLIMK